MPDVAPSVRRVKQRGRAPFRAFGRILRRILLTCGLAAFLYVVREAPRCAPVAELPGLGDGVRHVVDPDRPPWRIVGRLQTETGMRCTAFLVAPAVVETAAHCLYSRRTGRFIPPSAVHFLAGYRDGTYRDHAAGRRIVLAPDYDPLRPDATAGADRAAVVLDHPVAKMREVLAPAEGLQAGMRAMVGGYEQDRAERLTADTNCHLTGIMTSAPFLIGHDCAATHGASGAPLLVWSDGDWRIAGIVVRAARGEGGLAVPIPGVSR